MQQGLKTVLVRLKGEQVITVYLKPSAEAQAERQVLEQVRSIMGPEVQFESELVTPTEFLNRLKGPYPELVKDLEDLGQELNQIVPRYVSVSGVFSSHLVEKMREIPGVESAESSGDRYHHIVGAFSALRWTARVLMVGICLALLTGLIHLSRMNGYLHGESLSLLKLWGASSSVLLAPGMISGLAVGVIGGVIAAVGWLTAGVWFGRHIRSISPILRGLPPFYIQVAVVLLMAGGVIGVISGALGSLVGMPVDRERGSVG
jgi:cell division protein FtsX